MKLAVMLYEALIQFFTNFQLFLSWGTKVVNFFLRGTKNASVTVAVRCCPNNKLSHSPNALTLSYTSPKLWNFTTQEIVQASSSYATLWNTIPSNFPIGPHNTQPDNTHPRSLMPLSHFPNPLTLSYTSPKLWYYTSSLKLCCLIKHYHPIFP